MERREAKVRARHPLLLYRRLADYFRTPSLLLMVVSAGLLVWNHPALQELRLVLVITFLLPLALLLGTFIMSRLAYVQCREEGLFIRLPFHRLDVPYESVVETRATLMYQLFPPSEQRFSTRAFLDPLWNMSAVVVRLKYLPEPRQQLRLWMDHRMIIQNGLVLLVKDYMGFRREIQAAMILWRAGRPDSWGGILEARRGAPH